MPEFRIVDIYPNTFDIEITDLSLVLSNTPFDTDLSVPLLVGGEARAVDVRYSISEMRGVKPSDFYVDDVPHEMRRTTVELLMLNEVEHRLGLLLALILEKWDGHLEQVFRGVRVRSAPPESRCHKTMLRRFPHVVS
jgi:hypothetical protein